VKANELNLKRFLGQPETQFVIPVYQRNYDWTNVQCKQLIDDIINVSRNDKINAHFIGSIVYIHDGVYTSSGIRELTVIDGQQRLTTITLLYIAIYRLFKEMNREIDAERVLETFLTNKYAPKEKMKLLLTENNHKALLSLYQENEDDYPEYSRIIENFRYINTRLSKDNCDTFLNGLEKLVFVEISLDRGNDDPQKIFESLNSTGLELSQGDLIRNYILMKLKREEQLEIYNSYWKIIERFARDESKNENLVSDFIRDYLTLVNAKIPNKSKVYEEFKEKFAFDNIESEKLVLNDLKKLSKHYNKLINPQNENNFKIRVELDYINKLEVRTAYPFLLKVYDDFSDSIIDHNTFTEILLLIQSFAWRRFILALPTNALNKIFMTLYDKVDKNNYLFSIQKALVEKKGIQRFPRNKEFVDSLRYKDLYNIKQKNKIYMLEKLENYDNTEKVMIEDNPHITIEHIFPQNPHPKWKTQMSHEEYYTILEDYLHTIANLTLSGNNGKLGNKPFDDKKYLVPGGYVDSRLWLNRYLSTIDKWDLEEIKKRFELLAERALKIWKYPDIPEVADGTNGEMNIFEATDPTGKKLEYAILFDQKLEINSISSLYVKVMSVLFELQPDLFFNTDLGEKIGLKNTKLKNEIRQPGQIANSYFIELNMDSVNKIERIKHALTLFELEDELTIKYREK